MHPGVIGHRKTEHGEIVDIADDRHSVRDKVKRGRHSLEAGRLADAEVPRTRFLHPNRDP